MNMEFFDKAAQCFPDACFTRPVDVGFILGSGWSDALQMDEVIARISYGDIPGLGVLTELGYIKAGVDDLKRDNREIRGDLKTLDERVTRNEESTKQAHKRIDALSKYHEPDRR